MSLPPVPGCGPREGSDSKWSECRRARDAKRDIPVPLSPCARATTCTCRGRPAPGPRLRHFAPPPDPYDEWLDGVSDALASGLRQLRDLRPLRHFGQPLAPTPTADYPPRASRFPGGQRGNWRHPFDLSGLKHGPGIPLHRSGPREDSVRDANPRANSRCGNGTTDRLPASSRVVYERGIVRTTKAQRNGGVPLADPRIKAAAGVTYDSLRLLRGNERITRYRIIGLQKVGKHVWTRCSCVGRFSVVAISTGDAQDHARRGVKVRCASPIPPRTCGSTPDGPARPAPSPGFHPHRRWRRSR